ncbi:MAG: peptidoglycan-binding protein [Beijerinckiaceae bacterium]|nr:peptidoglycan-binding protein [Beijerinckiaceae bacterium]
MPDASTLPPLGQQRSAARQASKPGGKAAKAAPRWRDEALRLVHGETSLLRVVGRRIFHRPMRSLAAIVALGISGVILVNAVALQHDRHPAPFFAVAPVTSALPAKAPLPPARPASAPVQLSEADLVKQAVLNKDLQAELARRGFYIGVIDGKPGTRFEIAIREYEKAAGLPVTGQATEKLLTQVAASKLAMKDQLLLLIKDAGSTAQPERTRTVEGVQRALNKIGYGPLRTDGSFGATTKAAIERFERDRKLAVRGEPNGRFLKELSAASGMTID